MMQLSLPQRIVNVGNSFSTMRSERLKGKTAIVTASTAGIGFSIAKRLAQEGANIMISSRKENNVKSAVEKLQSEGLKVEGTVCHVGDSKDRKNLLEKAKAKYGGLDILVSNAAVNPTFGLLFDCTEEIWDKIFDTNVKSTFLLIKEALPLLRQSKSASVLVVSSVAGYMPMNYLGPYSISKTALLGLCKAAAEELITDGIRINCLAPGVIKTKFSQSLHESEGVSKTILEKIPIRRFGMPDEMGGIAAFLASDDASYITGEIIVVDGGMKSSL